ncbi:hypothetical protein X566_11030 [Afipia sp. P52-10]|nr:hypothetical protein X566_11030 [Afipia sp. P52-10]
MRGALVGDVWFEAGSRMISDTLAIADRAAGETSEQIMHENDAMSLAFEALAFEAGKL